MYSVIHMLYIKQINNYENNNNNNSNNIYAIFLIKQKLTWCKRNNNPVQYKLPTPFLSRIHMSVV